MASLTETAYVARKGIRYGAVGFVALLVLWFVGTGFWAWWKQMNPEPPPPPTADFGRLEDIKFPRSVATGSLTYELQTPTGKLGKFPDRMLVFYAPGRLSGFLDPDRAIDLATRLGFLFEPNQPSESEYRWTQSDPLPTTLDMNIISGHFKLKRQWQADPSLIVSKRFVSDQQVKNDALAFLRKAMLPTEDLIGMEKVTYLRAAADQLTTTVSLSEADFVKVDLFRKNYQIVNPEKKSEILAEYGFFTPDPAQGIVSVMLSGVSDGQRQIIEVLYNYITVDYDQTGEYPIKTVDKAWEELTSGGGYVASYDGEGVVKVRRVALGYYDSAGGEQKYEMPIYVFLGDDDFVGYVSAVREDALVAE